MNYTFRSFDFRDRAGARPFYDLLADIAAEEYGHKRLYHFSGADYAEAAAVFTGPHPETGEELEFVDDPPEGAEPDDLPPQPAVFAPGYSPEEIREIAGSLRERARLAG